MWESGLDKEIESGETAKCVKNNKSGGSDGLVREFLKYGGSGMIELLHRLFAIIWHEEFVPPLWRASLLIKG